jgi:hypothetical protein
MNELEQLWRERIDWVQASGLTIAAASAELGVSVASVYRWKKLLAASPASGRHRARPIMRTAACNSAVSCRSGTGRRSERQCSNALRGTRPQPHRSADCSPKRRRDPRGRKSGW